MKKFRAAMTDKQKAPFEKIRIVCKGIKPSQIDLPERLSVRHQK